VQAGGLAALTVLLLALVVWRTVVLTAAAQPGIIPM
jgi:hypothetical protein